MEAKHTPGPWSRVPQSNGSDLIAREYETGKQMNPNGLRLVAFTMARGASLKEDEANARLIAAAPELLEALHRVWDDIDDETMPATVEIIRAAIAKAEGR